MEAKTNGTNGKMTKEEKKEQRRRYIASYKEKIPKHIVEMAKEKKLFIERSDECIRVKKSGRGKKGYKNANGKWVKATDKESKHLRKIKPCGYRLETSTGIELGGEKHDLSLNELVKLIEAYDVDMENQQEQNKPYIKPMSHTMGKRFHISKKILRKLGLHYICKDSRFWIADKEENIIDGGMNGFSVRALFMRSLKLEEEAGLNKAGGKK